MRKLLKDMSREELRGLYEHNRHFREKAFEYAMENAYFWVDEYLRDLPRKAASYGFGAYMRCYFTIKNASDVLIWLEKAQKDFGLLADDEYMKVEFAWEMHCKLLYGVNDMSEDEEEALQAEFESILDTIAEYVQARLACEYEQFEDDENVFQYAYEMLENLFSEEAYVLQGEEAHAIYETVVHRYV